MAKYDVLIIGGGHAGAEAAWAASKLVERVAMVTLDPAKVGQMSCNPAIGGSAKGQIVREVDAMGGLMGLAADASGIQFRILNRSKGPAVHGPRAQCDKYRYAQAVREMLEAVPNLDIVAGEVASLDVRDNRCHGVTLADGRALSAEAVVVTTGTFMRGLMHTGEQKTAGGRAGEAASTGLSAELRRLGFDLGRLKTGTPPRLRAGSIDWSRLEEQQGDEVPRAFSFLEEYRRREKGGGMREEGQKHLGLGPSSLILPPSSFPSLTQVPCHVTHTTPAAHEAINANLHRAPMFSGEIEGVGPRYCPSIEDKVVRFADKQQHQIFLEPESLDTDEVYCNGISTSLPADAQRAMLDHIPGLEKAEVIRWGYAVEYDMVWPTQITATLETKKVRGLFLAGQINGTSGYEEAAGQGLVAGINAARYAATQVADFVLGRDQAYIGVLCDDLVTKPPTEPYRMFTSRAEHRLSLRSDNADERLTPLARDLGLVDDARWHGFTARRDALEAATAKAKSTRIDGHLVFDLIRRPESSIHDYDPTLPTDIAERVETAARYEGYLKRQGRQLKEMARLEHKAIPRELDYTTISGLRNEAREKLTLFTPRNLGQALRISGITPADVTLLSVHLARRR
ncbi:MAG: FAD-dependent oxidoreductase [Planctomycetota bacterium]